MSDGNPGVLDRNSRLLSLLTNILPGICLVLAAYFAMQFVTANSAAGELAAAPACSQDQSTIALQQSLDCVAALPGTVSMGINSGESNAVEIYYGTQAARHLLVGFTNNRDYLAVTSGVDQAGAPVTMNVWRGKVVSVVRNQAAIQTTENPGPRAVSALWTVVVVLAVAGVLRAIFGRLRLMAGIALVRRQRAELAQMEAAQNGAVIYAGPGTGAAPIPNIPKVQPMYVAQTSAPPPSQSAPPPAGLPPALARLEKSEKNPEQFTLRDFRMPKYDPDLPSRPQRSQGDLRSRIERRQQQ